MFLSFRKYRLRIIDDADIYQKKMEKEIKSESLVWESMIGPTRLSPIDRGSTAS
jgi:hypothetical protein